jgi:hypothetical protein
MRLIFAVLIYSFCAFVHSQTERCPGSTDLPVDMAAKMVAVNDPQLLESAIGKINMGGLCMGQTYEVKADQQVAVYRAWNSTNPGSQLGSWWGFDVPSGAISDYRIADEICYQWSPLDMLVICTLEPGQRIVVGPGQSAVCSPYLTYPASSQQQIYIQNAKSKLKNCTVKRGQFSWK